MVSLDTVLLVLLGTFSHLLDRLTNPVPVVTRSGSTGWRGWVNDILVTVTEANLVILVSLPKIIHGTNAIGLSPNDVRRALFELALTLGVDPVLMLEAFVRRIDVGANLVVSSPPLDYIRGLMEVPRAVRNPHTPWSLVFKNGLRELAFYDKLRQLAEKGYEIPRGWADKHVLRYELRLTRQITKEFGGPVIAEQLADPSFQNSLVGRWLDRFDTVSYHRPYRLGLAQTVPALRDSLALRGIEAEGGVPAVMDAINDARAAGTIDSAQATRMRGWLRSTSSSPSLTEESDLVKELRGAVRAAADLSRVTS